MQRQLDVAGENGGRGGEVARGLRCHVRRHARAGGGHRRGQGLPHHGCQGDGGGGGCQVGEIGALPGRLLLRALPRYN